MALGITLIEAEALVGKTRGMSNKQVAKALDVVAMVPRFRRGQGGGLRFATRAIIRVRWERPRRFHLVFKDTDEIFDPLYSKPAPSLDAWLNHLALTGGTVMGWLPLRTPGMLGNSRVASKP